MWDSAKSTCEPIFCLRAGARFVFYAKHPIYFNLARTAKYSTDLSGGVFRVTKKKMKKYISKVTGQKILAATLKAKQILKSTAGQPIYYN